MPGVLILRLDAPMYYANALTVRDQVKALVEEAETPPQALIFDAAAQDALDITSADVLKGLVKELQGQRHRGVRGRGACAGDRVRLASAGLIDVLSEDHIFPTVDAALAAIRASG